MPLRLLTAADREPISTEDAKLHLRVTQADQDALIDTLIIAVREWAEQFTGRAFIGTEWAYTLDGFPCGRLEIPKPPLNDVSSITYVDQNGDTQTWDAANYQVYGAYDVTADPPDTEIAPPHATHGYVVPVYGAFYPVTRAQPEAVTVTFTCGYGEDETAVPAAILAAMKIKLADLFYAQRESWTDGSTTMTNLTPIDMLLWPFKTEFA